MSSYGGNLSLVQEGDGQGGSIKSSTAIMTGNRASLHYIPDPEEAGVTRISLAERDWVRLDKGAPVPATRADMLRVLSDIQVNTRLSSVLLYSNQLDISRPCNDQDRHVGAEGDVGLGGCSW